MSEIRILLMGHDRAVADYKSWPTKKEALAHLKALRERGLNIEDCVRIHPAQNRFFRYWVIARPDGNHEMTWLMRADGSWVRGRLHDDTGNGAPWVHTPGTVGEIPPTLAHVTRVLPYSGRVERYRTKSNGSCGRWVRDDDSIALCTCGWRAHASTRAEARGAARWHRTNGEPATIGGAR